jgi:dual specificity tyrosine-phosphorylation-regulated kinase 2/3/4
MAPASNVSSASALYGSLRRDLSSSRRVIKTQQFPMKSGLALKSFKEDLTEYEQTEILEYKQVFFLSSLKFKRQADATLPNSGFDDERGDYLLATGDHMEYRYEVIELLGKGSFGQVVSCIDHKHKAKLAVKVIRNKQRFHKQALIEAKVLELLRQRDPEGQRHIVRMQSFFLFRSHLCITFELLSINLYDLIKLNHFQGFSSGLIRRFAVQILEALEYVRANAIIHCDLKPENILLCNTKHSDIKLIDFGSSCFDTQTVYTYIQSRFYRSPEIILGIPYTASIDMWSFGCIITEFVTGTPVFPGESEAEQLQIHMEMLGVPPAHVILRGSRSNLFFDRNLQPILTSSKAPGSKDLRELLEDAELCDLVTKCLNWDAKKRLSPAEGLSHPWLSSQKNLAIE